MRVIVWPASGDASSWYRLRWPAQALAAQGADVVVREGATEGPRITWDRRWTDEPGDARVMGCAKPDAEVVVLQRPARRYWAEVIPHLQAHGVKVVVDVDDDFTRIPRESGAWWTYNGGSAHAHGKWITRACQFADLVTVSTPTLLAVYGYGHGIVLPNLVPAAYLRVRPAKWLHSIGWTGSVKTHPTDLQVTGGAVQRAMTAVDGWHVRVVGTGHDVQAALGLTSAPRGTGWVPIEDYPSKVARLALGIVPLTDSRFNAAKSALKFSEMAALGVPVVASATPDNARLHRLGVGLLANSPQRWQKHLTRLMRNDDARLDLAARSREAMVGQTYEGNAGRWVDAWTRTITHTGKAA